MKTQSSIKTLLLLVLLVAAGGGVQGQEDSCINIHVASYVNYTQAPFDSLAISNSTGTRVYLWPDTFFYNCPTKIIENNGGLSFFQNFPNPFSESTRIQLQSSQGVQAEFQIMDLNGRIVYRKSVLLQSGGNLFDISGGSNGTYFLIANDGKEKAVAKLVKSGGEPAGNFSIQKIGVSSDFVPKSYVADDFFRIGERYWFHAFYTHNSEVVVERINRTIQNPTNYLTFCSVQMGDTSNFSLNNTVVEIYNHLSTSLNDNPTIRKICYRITFYDSTMVVESTEYSADGELLYGFADGEYKYRIEGLPDNVRTLYAADINSPLSEGNFLFYFGSLDQETISFWRQYSDYQPTVVNAYGRIVIRF